MLSYIQFVIIFFVALVGGFSLLEWLKNRKIRAIIKELGANGSDGLWHFIVKGRHVRLFYADSRNPSVSLSVIGNFKCQCVIRKELVIDKATKAIGLNKESSVTDPEIDSKVYFECEDDDFILRLTQNPNIKTPILGALQHFSYIKIEKGGCIVQKTAHLSSFKAEQIRKAGESLVEFVKYIPDADSVETLTPKTQEFESKLKIWGGYTFGLAATAFLAIFLDRSHFYPPVYPMVVVKKSILISTIFLTVLLIFMLKNFGGRSTSAKRISLMMIFAGVSISVCVWAVIRILNGVLDKSIVVTHETSVLSKNIYTGKYDTKYYLVLDPWEKGQSADDFQVSQSDYNAIPEAAACKVKTRSGYWGYEWISERRCEHTARPEQPLRHLKVPLPSVDTSKPEPFPILRFENKL